LMPKPKPAAKPKPRVPDYTRQSNTQPTPPTMRQQYGYFYQDSTA
jgi:hypothetical protein